MYADQRSIGKIPVFPDTYLKTSNLHICNRELGPKATQICIFFIPTVASAVFNTVKGVKKQYAVRKQRYKSADDWRKKREKKTRKLC